MAARELGNRTSGEVGRDVSASRVRRLGVHTEELCVLLLSEEERQHLRSPGGVGPRRSYALTTGAFRRAGE
eukprot:6887894-Lingulodinium_polyedra.AAC.1